MITCKHKAHGDERTGIFFFETEAQALPHSFITHSKVPDFL
jgi:hypothetical protein